jgi:hypothetical protein
MIQIQDRWIDITMVYRGGPGSNPGPVMWDFVMDKSGAGASFLRELRFLANLHSTCFSTIIFTITRDWHNRPGVAAVPIASQIRIKKKKDVLWLDGRVSIPGRGKIFFSFFFITSGPTL